MSIAWEQRFAQRTKSMQSSMIREILKLTQVQGLISFAGGLPAPDVFPIEEVEIACSQVLEKNGPTALQYSQTDGYGPLREYVVERTEKLGVKAVIENTVITSGSQQALDMLGKIFINPGDKIVVENPTYLGALQAWQAYGAEFVTVTSDENGLRTDELEAAFRCGPKFIYVLPNFQNPTGVTLTLERRKELVRLADQYGVPIVEDDPYGELRYEGEPVPSVLALDAEFRGNSGQEYDGNVIYLGTFSKILAPGFRLAWVVGPKRVISKIIQGKQGSDLHTSTFNQMVAYEVARNGFIDRHIEVIRDVYGGRRNIMLESLDTNFPKEAAWTKPEGGMFLWATLPEGIDTYELLPKAIDRMVAYVPGSQFHALGGGENTMRLNFSNASPDNIRIGIQRLGETIKENLR